MHEDFTPTQLVGEGKCLIAQQFYPTIKAININKLI